MERWKLATAHARAEVVAEAAMLASCDFILGADRIFTPFARAPWVGDPTLDPALPGHLRHLAAEFVCVPFGTGGYAPHGIDSAWAHLPMVERVVPEHGPTADAAWQALEIGPSTIMLRMDFPPEHDIAFVERALALDPHAPAIDFKLVIHARRATRQPVAVHPMFRLPDPPESVRIHADFIQGFTDPGANPVGTEPIAPWHRFDSLATVPRLDGDIADYSRLPHAQPQGTMLMLARARGPVTLTWPTERAGIRLDWDRALLPNAMLWATDRDPAFTLGGGEASMRCVAIEPIVAAFSLAPEGSLRANPLAQAGIPTAIEISGKTPTVIAYRIEAFET